MKKIRRNVSLNQRLAGISLAYLFLCTGIRIFCLADKCDFGICTVTKSVSYANSMQEILKNVWITVCIWLLSEKEIWKNLVTERQL